MPLPSGTTDGSIGGRGFSTFSVRTDSSRFDEGSCFILAKGGMNGSFLLGSLSSTGEVSPRRLFTSGCVISDFGMAK